MILAELNRLLLNVARSSYLVNDAFIGDVYTINGKENKFGCYVATPMSAVKESGTIRYTYYMYYIDRLTKDEANIDFVQSDAVSMLKGLLDYIESQGIEVESGYEFTLFRQKFSDWCAGAYVTVNMLTADNDCQEGGFNAGGYSLVDFTTDRNGIFTPPAPYEGFGRITVNVPQVGATEEWVDDEIDLKLTGYATQEWVNSRGFLTEHQDISGKADKGYVDATVAAAIAAIDLDSYASRTWVLGQDYLKDEDLDGYASQAWTNSQGFLKSNALTGYASQAWVEAQDYLKSDDLSDYVTGTWVNSQGFIKTDALDGYATQTWTNSQGFLKDDDLDGLATEQWVENQDYLKEDDLDGLASEEWVIRQGYLLSSAIDDMATESWVRSQNFLVSSDLEGYATEDFIRQQEFITISELCDYATQEWVRAQDYLTQDDLCGYATEQWVINWVTAQDYLQECDLDGYATEAWVLAQEYATQEWVDLNYASQAWVDYNFVRQSVMADYATKTWVENNFVSRELINNYVTLEELEEDYASKQWVLDKHYLTQADIMTKVDLSMIWSGTEDEWNALTQEEQCSYLIALITE